MISIGTMLQQLHPLVGTEDLSDWERTFVSELFERTKQGKETRGLSARQVYTLENLHRKHFAAY